MPLPSKPKWPRNRPTKWHCWFVASRSLHLYWAALANSAGTMFGRYQQLRPKFRNPTLALDLQIIQPRRIRKAPSQGALEQFLRRDSAELGFAHYYLLPASQSGTLSV